MIKKEHPIIVKPLLERFFPWNVLSVGDSIIQNVYSKQFLAKADEINQLNLFNIKSNKHSIELLIQTDDPNLRSIGWSCIAGMHTINGNYELASRAFSQADIEGISNESLAYMYLEISNYFRRIEYYSYAITILKIAESLTSNNNLKWRIRTIRGYVFSQTDTKKSKLILEKSLSHYQSTGEKIREVFVLKYLGILKLHLGEYDKAECYYNEALAVSDQLNDKEQLDVLIDIGWLKYLRKDYNKAREIFNRILKKDLTDDPYIKCLALQNLGCICGDMMDYKGVIKFHCQSLIYSEKYHMNDLIFEDYYKIASAYKKLNDSSLAAYWYNAGYLKVINEIKNKNHVLGSYQKLILEEGYIYLHDNRRQLYNNPTDQTFHLAVNISLQEIRRIFQTTFFLKQFSLTKSDIELCRKLNMSRKSLSNYKIKLNLHRNVLAKKSDNGNLDEYISSLLYLTWRDVIEKFEKDLFTYLIKEFNNNKKALAKSLAISYSSVCAKTTML